MLSNILGVSEVKARAVVDVFPSMDILISALKKNGPKELENRVAGLGSVLAQRIHETLICQT